MIDYILVFSGSVLVPIFLFFMKSAKNKHDETNRLISKQTQVLSTIANTMGIIEDTQKDLIATSIKSHDEHLGLQSHFAIANEKLTALSSSISDIHRRMD
jgi:predicted  nucleic acid-binding Zn-ribbon protein